MLSRQVSATFVFGLFSILSGNVSVVGSLHNTSNSSMNTSNEGLAQIATGFIGVIVGGIIGSVATYLFTIRIENRREKIAKRKEAEQRKSIALLVQHELEIYSANIETQLGFIQKEPNVYGINEDINMFMNNFKTLPLYYISMTPEIKARVFDPDTLEKVDKAYREIQLFIANLDAMLTSLRTGSPDFETRIKSLKGFISKASESISNMISNMKID